MISLRRRTLLATVVAGAAASCTSDKDNERAAPPSTPDPQLADLAAERALIAQYDRAIDTHPALRDRLVPLRDQHADHERALADLVGAAAASATPTATTPAGSTGSASPESSAAPADPTATLAALRAAERAAAAARTASCVAASTDRAPLLGSIAACEASHEVVLV